MLFVRTSKLQIPYDICNYTYVILMFRKTVFSAPVSLLNIKAGLFEQKKLKSKYNAVFQSKSNICIVLL